MKLGKHVNLNLRDEHNLTPSSPGQLVQWAWFAKGYGNDSMSNSLGIIIAIDHDHMGKNTWVLWS